jgi:hypothetical protein
MSRQITMQTWRGFAGGEHVVMLVETKGATVDDEEVAYPPGTEATIDALADFGDYQGYGVHITVGRGHRSICNSFDDKDVEDLGGIPFRHI